MFSFLKWASLFLLVFVVLLGGAIYVIAPKSKHHASADINAEELSKHLSPEAASAAATKIRAIETGLRSGESFGTVTLSEEEINSYLQYQLGPELPPGISNIRIKLEDGRPRGTATVNFDELRIGDSSMAGPLLGMILKGSHTVGFDGRLSSARGVANFQTDEVTVDDKKLPPAAVQFLYDHYLQNRFPDVALNAPFRLPPAVEKLSVGSGSVSVEGKQLAATKEKAEALANEYKDKLGAKALPASARR
jgi:hypothetical protein